MKLTKLNQKGLAHWLAPAVFVFIIAVVGVRVLTMSHAATISTYGCNVQTKLPTIQQGSTGNCVKYAQALLNLNLKLDFNSKTNIAVDGNYGPNTLAAVKEFQKDVKVRHPSFQVDGIIGTNTWTALQTFNYEG